MKKTKKEVSQSKLTSLLNNPDRFKTLEDGYIQDNFTGLEWGPSSDKKMNMKDALKYCEKLDARLPEIHELHSLVNYSKRNPAINEIFKYTKSDDWYWSSTKHSYYTNASWCVSFFYGGVYDNFESNNNYVRPVRSSQ